MLRSSINLLNYYSQESQEVITAKILKPFEKKNKRARSRFNTRFHQENVKLLMIHNLLQVLKNDGNNS